jgi:glycosyltransferase involved in cell wall biosynthesis
VQESRNSSEGYQKSFDFKKIIFTAKDVCTFFAAVVNHKPHVFYTILPTSFLGGLKVLILIAIFKIFSYGEIVIHIHRGDFIDFSSGLQGVFLCKFINALVERVVVLSESQRLAMLNLGYKSVHYLPNSIAEIDCKYSYKKKSRLICISNYLPGKGHIVLLDALKILQNEDVYFEMIFYGSGSFELYKKYAEDIGLRRVYFQGPIFGVEKFTAISEAEALIMPSMNEGQPLVIIEAMSVGTVVVATDVGLVKEMLNDDYEYLTKAGDSRGLADVIKLELNLINKEEVSRKLLDRYKMLFSSVAHRSKLLQIFSLSNMT